MGELSTRRDSGSAGSVALKMRSRLFMLVLVVFCFVLLLVVVVVVMLVVVVVVVVVDFGSYLCGLCTCYKEGGYLALFDTNVEQGFLSYTIPTSACTLGAMKEDIRTGGPGRGSEGGGSIRQPAAMVGIAMPLR